ncbi:MAG: 3-dehydroquinate synthase [Kiritimatiellia bacterium]
MSDLLFLYGPPGSGKSTLGKVLASRFGVPFLDLDAVIVEEAGGVSIPEIFARETEKGFRARELAALKAVGTRGAAVVALGGGALVDPAARAVAEGLGRILFLDVPRDVLAARVMSQRGTRPLASARDRLQALLDARAAHYGSFPVRLNQTAEQADEAPEARADRAETVLGRFRILSGDVPSDVRVGAGTLDRLGAFAKSCGLGARSVVVCDSVTASPYGARAVASLRAAGIAATLATIPAGEETKTIATVADIWRAFLSAGLGRCDFAVAVGGGVVGDMTGFASATWMRGMAWINVPTTLLSMVDASTGGKTGCDLPEGKNLVGAFHSPSGVLADVATLSTLPPREIRCGLAEALKHAFIADPGLLEVPDFSDVAAVADYVRRALAVKVGVVRRDPREKGDRAKLNLGHTVGHAVEIATGFGVRHGEAVAIGVVEEARLAVRLGLAGADWPARVAAPFAAVGLPTELPDGVTFASLVPVMKRDKKKNGAVVEFALPCGLPDVRLVPVSLDTLSIAG